MARHIINVHIERLATDTGIWCDNCLLPSATTGYYVRWIGDKQPEFMAPNLIPTVCDNCGPID